ncbi:FtsX-like permease family protein [Streptomyces sp. NPDC003635]
MSALGGVVRAGLGRRRLQTTVMILTTLIAVTASVLAAGVLVASRAPFDHAMAERSGAHLAAWFDARKATAAQLAATARVSEVSAVAGPFRTVSVSPRTDDSVPLPELTVVGRAEAGGPVDRLDLADGRWATGPGEIVLAEGETALSPGAELRVGGTTLTVVGLARSVTGTADAWVTPAQAKALAAGGGAAGFEMLYRLRAAGTESELSAGRAAIEAAAPEGALTGTLSYLSVRREQLANALAFVPFVAAFGVLGLAMSVLIIGVVVSGSVGSATRRIGILKSLGFTPAQVVRAYVAQALVPATIGCALGVALGNVLCGPVLGGVEDVYNGAPATIPWWLNAAAPTLALALVTAAALLPALRAGRLRPMEALTPGRTRRTRPARPALRRNPRPAKGTPAPRTTPHPADNTPAPRTTPHPADNTPAPRTTPHPADNTPAPRTTPLPADHTPATRPQLPPRPTTPPRPPDGTPDPRTEPRPRPSTPRPSDRVPALRPARRVRRLVSRLPLPRPVTLGLAQPLDRPARALTTGAAVALGALTVTFAVGLALTLGAVQEQRMLDSAAPVVVETGRGQGGPGGAVTMPAPGQRPVRQADPADVVAALDGQASTRRYYAAAHAEVSAAGIPGRTAVTAYDGDSSWGAPAMVAGRWIRGSGEAVVTERFLDTAGVRVGDTVTLSARDRSTTVRIVGEAFFTEDEGMTLLTGTATLTALGLDAAPARFHAQPESGTSTSAYVDALNEALADTGALALTDTGNSSSVIAAMDALIATLTLLLVAVAGLGVLNTVVLDTRDRVHDLGVHKALGMTPRQTVTLTLTSVGALGLLAGAVGVPAGVALHHYVVPLMGDAVGMNLPPRHIDVYAPAALALLALGGPLIAIAGALLPAGWAARTDTARALRTE